jgi:hypothetical protein
MLRARGVTFYSTVFAARVRSQVRSCGICDGLCGTGAGFLRVPRISLTTIILLTVTHAIYCPDIDSGVK